MNPKPLAALFCAFLAVSAARAESVPLSPAPAAADSGLASLVASQSLRLSALEAQRDEDRVRSKLSTLWTMVSIQMVGADVLTSFIPGAQSELERFAGGPNKVKYYMLAGGITYEIPISMIFMSSFLPYGGARWANVGAAAATSFLIWGGASGEPHYILIASMETLTLGYAAWTAWRWKDPAEAAKALSSRKHDVGLMMDAPSEAYGLKYTFRF